MSVYTLHLGALMTSASYRMRLSDYESAQVVESAKPGVFVITTDAELTYQVVSDSDSWSQWGEHLADGTMHLTVGLTHMPSTTEVQLIYRAIAKALRGGRLADWVALTNAENWSEHVGVYLAAPDVPMHFLEE